MNVRLAVVTPTTFQALAAGDIVAAQAQLGLPIPQAFAEAVDIWRFMNTLANEQPANADWLMRAVVADDVIVGNAGFKGAPVDGRAELGYRILPDHRRRGLALAAVRLLVDHACSTQGLDRVIARIAPDNEASVRVVTAAGFVPDGEHISPRWGRQLQFAMQTPGPDA
ncbi:GNAT family N-acetyltransferase [Aeromicrobium sp. S22]|uniref:GNAT family N-acetyltransferase n=1 Tax=Aeromicrobium sp. S22 TaxID=2662029 RepID=UPI00129D4591|nr:GNAT family N-acetyltransferase [Aeromicrobium sp. S22]MRK00620.1 GNAT family N-acetyltransferase [Aeromicrobium sp. S22]